MLNKRGHPLLLAGLGVAGYVLDTSTGPARHQPGGKAKPCGAISGTGQRLGQASAKLTDILARG